jgi:hypothetical protein
MQIIKSASKLMFLLLGITACIGFATGLLSSENFMVLASSAFAFYFSNKGDTTQPFAGK